MRPISFTGFHRSPLALSECNIMTTAAPAAGLYPVAQSGPYTLAYASNCSDILLINQDGITLRTYQRMSAALTGLNLLSSKPTSN